MATKHSMPAKVRHGKAVGPDYPEENFCIPWNQGIDEGYYHGESRTMHGPTDTVGGMGIPLSHNYDKFWEGESR